jgi:hypothetical protein
VPVRVREPLTHAIDAQRAHGLDQVALVPEQVAAQPHAQLRKAREQRHAGLALELANGAGHALGGPQSKEHVHVVLPDDELGQLEVPLVARLANERLQRLDVAILEHGPAPARVPRDEVVELAAIHGLPVLRERLLHLGGQFDFHGTSSCGDR